MVDGWFDALTYNYSPAERLRRLSQGPGSDFRC